MNNKKILKGIGIFCILASIFAMGVSLWKGDGFSSAGLGSAAIGLILIALSSPSSDKKE